ncbi:autotransporter domain-containing protein [Aquabacterium lacunae]|nr:autotransporter domain-containing protein [Aquabacterium lacunae]
MLSRKLPARFKPQPLAALLLVLGASAQAQAAPAAASGPSNSGPTLCTLTQAGGNTISSDCEGSNPAPLDWTAGNVTVNAGATISLLRAYVGLGNSPATAVTWVNNGTMVGSTASYSPALSDFDANASYFSFINNGTFNGNASLFNTIGSIDLLTNTGVWDATSSGYGAIFNGQEGRINTLTNTGSITSGSEYSASITNSGVVNTLTNTGTIQAQSTNPAISNYGVINTLNNEGMLLGGSTGFGIYNNFDRSYPGVAAGRIVTLNNLQGGATPLTFRGILPENYNVIIRSPSQYGKLVVMQPALESRRATLLVQAPVDAATPLFGTMRFGIAQGSTVASTTYTDVLSGLSAADLGNALTGNYNGFRWALSDADNNQVWDLILSLNAVATSAVTPRAPVASGAAAVIDANSALLDLFGNVQADSGMLSNAVTQTLPFLAGGSATLTQGAMGRINQVIQGRFDANRGASAGNSYFGNGSLWFKPFGGKVVQGDVGGTPGYKANLYGLSGGVEGDASPATRLGLAYAYAQNDMGGRGATSPQSGQTTIHQLIGYGTHQLDERTSLDFQVDLGSNRNTTRRFMAFAGATATASYESSTAHVGLGVQRSYSLADGLKVSPFARIDYTLVEDDAYTENGAGLLNLSVAAKRTESYVSTLGASLQRALNDRSNLVARAGIGYDHSHGKGVLTAAYAGAPAASFTTNGALPAPWLATLGLGLSWRTLGGPELLTQYDLELREKFTNQTVSFKLRWAF